jgi:hypothetical protein
MNEAIIHGSASSKVESSYPDFILKKSASFGDFSANLMKSKLLKLIYVDIVEGNRTEFSIVAPKGENDLYVS